MYCNKQTKLGLLFAGFISVFLVVLEVVYNLILQFN